MWYLEGDDLEFVAVCGVTIACDGAWPTRRNNPVGHTVGRLVRTTWGGPRDIAASGLRDPLSEATGLAAMPAIGQVEYLTTDGANQRGPTRISASTRS